MGPHNSEISREKKQLGRAAEVKTRSHFHISNFICFVRVLMSSSRQNVAFSSFPIWIPIQMGISFNTAVQPMIHTKLSCYVLNFTMEQLMFTLRFQSWPIKKFFVLAFSVFYVNIHSAEPCMEHSTYPSLYIPIPRYLFNQQAEC